MDNEFPIFGLMMRRGSRRLSGRDEPLCMERVAAASVGIGDANRLIKLENLRSEALGAILTIHD